MIKQLQILIAKLQELILSLQQFLNKRKKEIGNDFEKFALALRKRESSDNYKIVNAFGYMGAYQFGMARLYDLGYTKRKPGTTGYSNRVFEWKTGYSKEYFLNNLEFQDKIFKQHVINLIRQIKSRFTEYIGKSHNGLEITLSGLVAGAHLGGIGGVNNFLRRNHNSSDQFGTSLSDYIKKFRGYNLENL